MISLGNLKKIVVCPDSFKGSLSAKDVADTIINNIRAIKNNIEIINLPLADGGEGTSELLYQKVFPIKRSTYAHDPLGRLIEVEYLGDMTGEKAFIESAAVIGLPLLNKEERNPLLTSSFGLGELIKDAINKGYKEITVALGGSSTNDGGMGMLSVLGYIFEDKDGNLLSGEGKSLSKETKIKVSDIKDLIKQTKFTTICDVTNTLLGENGATKIYAPQKGATEDEIEILENGMHNYVRALKKAFPGRMENLNQPGDGAAGGLGFALRTMLDSKNIRGIDYILDLLDFNSIIKDADLIITGEGKIDKQSLMGKVLSGVINRAKNFNIPVLAIGGSIEDRDILDRENLITYRAISDPSKTLAENMKKPIAIENLGNTIRNFFLGNRVDAPYDA